MRPAYKRWEEIYENGVKYSLCFISELNYKYLWLDTQLFSVDGEIKLWQALMMHFMFNCLSLRYLFDL